MTAASSAQPATPVADLAADVRRLVIAARIVTDDGDGSDEAQELRDAVEAFSSRVPYDQELCGAPSCTAITSTGICDDCSEWVELEAGKLERSPDQPRPPFQHPTAAEFGAAERIVNSQPVIAAFAACEWEELGDDGRVWIAAIVREAQRQPQMISGELVADINTFIIHMAKHYRRRTSRRVFGVRVNTMSRTDAMAAALATYDATLDIMGVPFGHPDHAWDRETAHLFVDDDLQHWEA